MSPTVTVVLQLGAGPVSPRLHAVHTISDSDTSTIQNEAGGALVVGIGRSYPSKPRGYSKCESKRASESYSL